MANMYHVRSISLPSRSHPTTLKIQQELNKLRSWETSSRSMPETICMHWPVWTGRAAEILG
ncbi:hypothetical protein AAG906_015822 [Vitis piasezkii]